MDARKDRYGEGGTLAFTVRKIVRKGSRADVLAGRKAKGELLPEAVMAGGQPRDCEELCTAARTQ